MLNSVKMALRITTDAYDEELKELIEAAYLDLGIAGVITETNKDPLVGLAVKTYCKLHFGEPADYERLKRSYDEQKAQLSMAANYTDYSMLEKAA